MKYIKCKLYVCKYGCRPVRLNVRIHVRCTVQKCIAIQTLSVCSFPKQAISNVNANLVLMELEKSVQVSLINVRLLYDAKKHGGYRRVRRLL